MSAVYIPTVAPNATAASASSKANAQSSISGKDLDAYLAEQGVSTTLDGLNAGSAEIFQNFFDIAFSQLTGRNAIGQIDVYRQPAQTEGTGITLKTQNAANASGQVNNLADFGRAFNFDPILNLTTTSSSADILGSLDDAGQAQLIEQLIGALPADVISTAFEQFDVQAGIEGYDIPSSLTGEMTAQSTADELALYMAPIKPLQSLQGQTTATDNITKPSPADGVRKNDATPALIATGLTPDQITQLSESQSEIDMQDLAEMDVMIVTILPAETPIVAAAAAQFGLSQSANAGQDTLKGIKSRGDNINGSAPLSSADLKALKDMVDQLVPSEQGANNRNAAAQSNASENAGQLNQAAQNASHSAIPFSALVNDENVFMPKDINVFAKENAATTANRDLPFTDVNSDGQAVSPQNINATKNKTSIGPNGQMTNAQSMAAKSQMMAETSGLVPWDSIPEAEMGYDADGISIGQMLQNSPHTSPSLMHAHAATPHQATQAIAAKLTQSSTQKGETELQIELDPPELGRVKVHLIQDGDGGVKAHLSFDKPETFLMMQRDQAQLEKALADAGLDVGDSGIEFSLSSDNGGDNAQNGDRQDGQSYSGGRDGNHADADGADTQDMVIETKMDWYTDATGALRLDMMA